jgi:stage III sporulation protein AA
MPSTKEIILSFLSANPGSLLARLSDEVFSNLTEVRLRADKPLCVRINRREYVALANPAQAYKHDASSQNVSSQNASSGNASPPDGWVLSSGSVPNPYCPTLKDIADTVERMSRHSLYAFESALRQGYMTLPGGHRAGIAGQAVMPAPGDGRQLRTVTNISSINLRVAHAVKGCADYVLPFICDVKALSFCHTLIISPPACGKTTLLRDIVRQISNAGFTVGLVDERSEVAGCYRGVAQNDVGLRTDVLDGCPKAEGIVMLLRAMSPHVIAVDELGGERDARAVEDVLNAGVKLLCTAHARDMTDLKRCPMLKELMKQEIFERYVVLNAPGSVAGVYDGRGGSYVG